MSDVIIPFSIPLDDDGYLTLQCPFCVKQFKLTGEDVEDDSVYELFCPYCGLVTEPSEFLSDEVKEKAMRLAENQLYDLLNGFMGDMKKTFRNSKSVKVKTGSKFKMNDPKTIIESDSMERYHLSCCEREIKAFLIDDTLYCPFCGGETHGTNIG
ncbi:hypothetical protein MPH47_09800 [Psychrobacillus psychrodurans]|uniref:hypothetical protein n=1 Tax=Psychrobacillus psychrodurans TaxID=126157 RepID=UPI001F4E0580|nr:hypothetical protein [Psychrobacillus psychrodurans]MCK1997510.1 hypothetical protein [Psychrobacillus psychrodurans]